MQGEIHIGEESAGELGRAGRNDGEVWRRLLWKVSTFFERYANCHEPASYGCATQVEIAAFDDAARALAGDEDRLRENYLYRQRSLLRDVPLTDSQLHANVVFFEDPEGSVTSVPTHDLLRRVSDLSGRSYPIRSYAFLAAGTDLLTWAGSRVIYNTLLTGNSEKALKISTDA